FTDTPPPATYTLSLHDALPICSKGFRTPDASDKTEGGETNLNLKTVQRMLPLVQQIVDDILASQKALRHLQPEEEALDRKKRVRSEEHTSELQSPYDLVCRLLL